MHASRCSRRASPSAASAAAAVREAQHLMAFCRTAHERLLGAGCCCNAAAASCSNST
jgi:hypothetical protein